jgi:hypothetical protein
MSRRLRAVLVILILVGGAMVLSSPLAAQQSPLAASGDLTRHVADLAVLVQKQQQQIEALQHSQAELLQELRASRAASPGVEGATASAVAPAQSGEATGTPQYSGQPNDPELAMATKANGGDLSGLGNLLRTQRITLGGYGDFQFRQSSLNERNDGGGTPTFQSTRFVLGIAAVLAKKQNIVFNSEIEYELGASEIDVEQAFVDWKMRPEFSFRGGIFVPALGRFNTYHDSNLNLLTLRPLINQYIVPTAYRDAGIGVRGRISLPHEMKLTYEADVMNGMQGFDDDGVATPFSRLVGQSSAAEPVSIAFQDNNANKALAGRLGFSPILGLEFGISGYTGRFNNLGTPADSVNILFLDGSYQRGRWAINGEYGRSNIVGPGIARRSPAPPAVNLSDSASVAALAQFVAQTSPGQDGFYLESAYKFKPGGFFSEKFDEGAYIAPVLRVETVRLDRTIPDFYLNRWRVTPGLNIAPSASVFFKLGYAFNHPFGTVPRIPGPIGGADFGNNPIPFSDYGKNGLVGSIAYVF